MTFICMEMKRCDFFVVAVAHEFVIMTVPGSVYDNSVVSVDTSISAENKLNKTFVSFPKFHQLEYIALNKNAWWRHQMETFSALLAICAGNSPVTSEFRCTKAAAAELG